ncbi:TetR family transcriptional regulator [Pseudomonas aeruginosa]|uniref:TetR/AcrR family transcriptional regulator n=1 Tax=Pseudomonas aeruginosa TaxID=287 RepID=UPI001068B9B4|nr:TetR/AcrR family transcriptional regulator [Pseudomonas aeruginosa]TEO19046.1 TetR family transcriptional regulator [Pseudomonas aeruginosa]TEO21266.1 TetR family transcriptional regulator [Pseudomonas aeruginosa]TEO25772.1 TetR family transcriptional regulator [Pseudomonas aeruginosa]TEO42462.1 TetR family transcriptional regulator [Pseudomonas aeruginosa]
MSKQESTDLGWRERKRRGTHKRVWESAIALFGANGYEATTLDAIAEASGISKRTFFHYFASKEEVLAAWQADVPDMFRAAIAEEPAGDTPIELVGNVLAKMPVHLNADQAVLINRIIRSSEQLRAGNLAKFLRLEEAAFEALCERWPAPERREGLRVVAMASIGALRLAIDRFAEEDGRTPLVEVVEAALAGLKAELSHA